ncbi:MAG: phage terminase large subunit family protein, partial [SAR324 cluster bacterium]|nr:phage terminase large subunit family protein [SAR324 cluster bacterium]
MMTIPYISKPKRQKSQRKIISRSAFVSALFKTDSGRPFKFDGREYLKKIYNYSYRYVVLLASRQAEKSTLLSKDMLSDGILNSNDSLLYVTAQQRQADEFVHRKINRQFDLNPALEHDYLGPGSINNIRDKILSNGTTFAFRAIGQNADSARGIPARKIYFDEVQSILSDNIPIVTECAQSFPDDSAYSFAGTPLSTKNVLSQKFYKTKQFEWLITCGHCGRINPPLGMDHIDISRPFLFCLNCGKDLVARNGEWVAMNPESTLAGFRICRLMTPTCTWRTPANDGVLDKLEMYSESSFY